MTTTNSTCLCGKTVTRTCGYCGFDPSMPAPAPTTTATQRRVSRMLAQRGPLAPKAPKATTVADAQEAVAAKQRASVVAAKPAHNFPALNAAAHTQPVAAVAQVPAASKPKRVKPATAKASAATSANKDAAVRVAATADPMADMRHLDNAALLRAYGVLQGKLLANPNDGVARTKATAVLAVLKERDLGVTEATATRALAALPVAKPTPVVAKGKAGKQAQAVASRAKADTAMDKAAASPLSRPGATRPQATVGQSQALARMADGRTVKATLLAHLASVKVYEPTQVAAALAKAPKDLSTTLSAYWAASGDQRKKVLCREAQALAKSSK